MFKQAHTIKNNPAVLLGEIHPHLGTTFLYMIPLKPDLLRE